MGLPSALDQRIEACAVGAHSRVATVSDRLPSGDNDSLPICLRSRTTSPSVVDALRRIPPSERSERGPPQSRDGPSPRVLLRPSDRAGPRPWLASVSSAGPARRRSRSPSMTPTRPGLRSPTPHFGRWPGTREPAPTPPNDAPRARAPRRSSAASSGTSPASSTAYSSHGNPKNTTRSAALGKPLDGHRSFGKVERLNRTLLTEWAYARIFTSGTQRAAALPQWLHSYNHHRAHTALGGRAPISRVNNLTGHYS